MNLFAQLRIVVLLRRGVRALESLALSQSILAMSVKSREKRIADRLARRKSPGRTHFDVIDTVEVQRRYDEQQKIDRVDRG